MSVAWTINGQSLADLGLEFTGGTFRTGAASEMRLTRTGDFTAEHLFSHGQAVALVRDGSLFFQGKVRDRSAGATADREGQDIVVVDAWDELEATVYEEQWAAGSGGVSLPIAILGRKSNGDAITDSQQIVEAVAFAVSAGISIQMGSIPTGLPLWQSEVRNTSIAEVIRLSLRFHPDWIPWLDHSTTPPTLNVTPRATATLRTISISAGDSDSVNIRRRDDLLVDAVKLTYLTATVIDGEVYRDGVIDKFPVAGPDVGPRVLSTVVELAGAKMQFQKSRIQTRDLPTSQATAKAWLKLKFPHLKNVPDGHFDVTAFEKTLVEDTEEHPDPVNPAAIRLPVADATDLPRELVRGTIEDWMRRKVGKVRIAAGIKATGSASGESLSAILKGTPPLTVTATNAVNKTYKGVSQWTPPEDAPAGIATAVYNALSTYQFEGSIRTVNDDVTGVRFHGCRLRITGGHGDWATMDAIIHAVDFDVATGSMTVSVGPAPFLGAEDMLELQRLLRSRPVTWMSSDERTSNELGAEHDPGSKGDTLSGYDQPETFMDPTAGGASFPASLVPVKFVDDDGDWSVVFSRAKLWEQSLLEAGKGHEILVSVDGSDVALTTDPEITLSSGANDVWLSVGVSQEGTVSTGEVRLVIGTMPEASQMEPKRPTSGTDGIHVQKVGVITVSGDPGVEPVWQPECTSTVMHLFVPQIEDTGEGVPVYNSHADGIDKFRKINNATSEGFEIVLTTEGPEGFGDEVKLRRLRNLGSQTTGGAAAVIKDQSDTEIRFRGIGGRPSEPQITTEIQGDSIVVKGNNNTTDYSGYRCTAISVKDGLVVDADFEGEESSEGWWGTIEWEFQDVASGGASSNWCGVKMKYERGILVRVDDYLSEGSYTERPGDEESPGFFKYTAINTHPEE